LLKDKPEKDKAIKKEDAVAQNGANYCVFNG